MCLTFQGNTCQELQYNNYIRITNENDNFLLINIPGVSEGLATLVFRPKLYCGVLSNIILDFSGEYAPGAGVSDGFSKLVFNPKEYCGVWSNITFAFSGQ